MKAKKRPWARINQYLRDRGESVGRYLRDLSADLRKTGLYRIALIFAAFIAFDAIVVYLIERASGNEQFRNLMDGFWWSFVTNATVGYGDKAPISQGARLVAMFFMLACIVVTAIISGTVASIFVERRIREGKGLQDIIARGHVILCGWNRNAANIVESVRLASESKRTALVLLNESEEDWFDGIKSRFPSMDLRYVRGDFTNESMLKRAAVDRAKAVLIVPDESGKNVQANADERCILAALAVKSLNPDAKVSAEILRPESESHLKRAGVDDIVLNGEFSGYLLSSSFGSRGVPEAARRMLTPGKGELVRNAQIPPQLVGKPFLEASEWFMRNGKGLLIGILSEEKRVSLDDLVSNDSSAIDDFIRRKFQEADISLDDGSEAATDVRLNPGPDYLIRDTDLAFVVGQGA
jgi:voltage-gated potassium channel